VLADEEVAVVKGCGADFDEELAAAWGGLGDFVEGERVVDLARLAFDLGDGDGFGHVGGRFRVRWRVCEEGLWGGWLND
jgi:hypothetical protein